jgi:hypothetical protein
MISIANFFPKNNSEKKFGIKRAEDLLVFVYLNIILLEFAF